jgi:hypothetical protein
MARRKHALELCRGINFQPVWNVKQSSNDVAERTRGGWPARHVRADQSAVVRTVDACYDVGHRIKTTRGRFVADLKMKQANRVTFLRI